jgi:hypothetical protein
MCRSTLVAQMAAMNDAGDARGAAYVAVQLTKVLEAIARVTGELGDLARSQTFNIVNNNVAVLQDHPAFARVRSSLLHALQPFPDARSAVVTALRDLDAGNAPARPAGPAGKLLELQAANAGG